MANFNVNTQCVKIKPWFHNGIIIPKTIVNMVNIIIGIFIFTWSIQTIGANEQTLAVGKALFKGECANCHTLKNTENGSGPSLYGIVGRRVAAIPGYKYSTTLLTSNFIWSKENLIKYINNPSVAIPCRPIRIGAVAMCDGIHMSFQGLNNLNATKAIVMYLESLGVQQSYKK